MILIHPLIVPPLIIIPVVVCSICCGARLLCVDPDIVDLAADLALDHQASTCFDSPHIVQILINMQVHTECVCERDLNKSREAWKGMLDGRRSRKRQ
jgi:hypothetical protein